MGLVIRFHVKISEASSPVVSAMLTDEGRRVAQALARGVPEPAGDGAPVAVPPQPVSPSPVWCNPSESLFAPGPVGHDGQKGRGM